MNIEAQELILYMENDSGLYPQRLSIEKNLARKITKGIFNPTLSIKLWMYWVDNGAKKYCREFGCTVKHTFPKPTKLLAAEYFAKEFMALYA